MQNRPSFMVRTGFLGRIVLAVLCCASLLTLALPAAAEKQILATPGQSSMSMLPHLEWLLDSSGKLTVEDMALPQQQAAFRPLKLQQLPQEAGTVWLRFTMAGRPSEVRPATLLLDMGDGVPDTPTLFVPKFNLLTSLTEWQSFSPSQRSVFLMPETRHEPVTAYIRLDGLPGLWFSPMLRTPHNAATALERLARPAVIVALGVIMLLCLLRGLTERGEWRIWTSLYTAAALVHAVWGVPATAKGHVDMLNMAAVLAPGVGLMILPHVGRHLLRTRQTSRSIDIQLFLLSLPGAAVALLPLLPGYSWTTRFLDLWPAGTIVLVPTILGAWLCGLPGARRFLLGCLLPPVGVAVGILGMGADIPASLLGTAPLWGLALSALIIAGTAAPQEHRTAAAASSAAAVRSSAQDLVNEDPNLRIVSPEELAQGTESMPAVAGSSDSRALAVEDSLRGLMDDLLRDGAALAQCALPPVPRQLAEAMTHSVHRMATTLAGGPAASALHAVREDSIFDLQEVLRQAHDSVSAVADSKSIALSWFMPPHLGQRYRGSVAQLGEVLRLLLESAVRATSRGAVQLAVRRVPESVNPGHLLFSVTDTGTGMPPQERSSVALARAWELAGANRGFLGVECSPHGAMISFTLHLEATTADLGTGANAPQGLENLASPGIIVVEDSPGERQLLAFFLEGLGATVIEARSADEAVDLYMDSPAQLLIFDGDLPPTALCMAVERVRTYEQAEGTLPALIMGLSSNDNQWEILRQAGFTHALPKPITRSGLRSTVCQLLPQCAAQESLTPEMDMSRPLPSLPLRDVPVGESGSAASDGDDGDIIDTGMPMLDMDTASAPPPLFAGADALRKDVPRAAPDAAYESAQDLQAPQAFLTMQTPTSAREAPLPDLFPSDGELTLPLHATPTAAVASPHQMLPEQVLPDQILPESEMAAQPLLVAMPRRVPKAEHGPEPVLENEEFAALHSGTATEKSHEDYLTSLLDGSDDLLRSTSEPVMPLAEPPLLPDADADVAQAVREESMDAFSTENSLGDVVFGDTDETLEETPRDLAEAEMPSEAEGEGAGTPPGALTEPPEAGAAVPSAVPAWAPSDTTVEEPPVASVGEASDALLMEPSTGAPPVPPEARPEILSEILPEVLPDMTAPAHVEAPTPLPSSAAESAVTIVSGVSLKVSPASSPKQTWQPDNADRGDGTSDGTSDDRGENSVEWVGEPRPVSAPAAVKTDGLAKADNADDADATSSSPQRMSAEVRSKEDKVSLSAPTISIKVTKRSASRAPEGAVEWVGEPRPVERPAAPAAPAVVPVVPVVETVTPEGTPAPSVELAAAPELAVETAVEPTAAPEPVEAAVEPTAEAVSPPASAPVQQTEPEPELTRSFTPLDEDFVPLSLHPETASSAQERSHLTLLPQGTPLMDFIIAEPTEAPAAASPPPVAQHGEHPVSPLPEQSVFSPQVQSEPTLTVTPSRYAAPAPAPAPIVVETPPRNSQDTVSTAAPSSRISATVLKTGYGSVGEPTPIVRPDDGKPTQDVPLARLLDYFDQAAQHARQSFQKKDAEGVHEGAAYIARQADKVGLRTLARMARCVADAGKAGDMDAVKDLLPELESTVERTRIALGG